jgi:hypothetical protein
VAGPVGPRISLGNRSTPANGRPQRIPYRLRRHGSPGAVTYSLLEGGRSRVRCGIPSATRCNGRVTGFALAASSSRTGDHIAAVMLSTDGGILSTIGASGSSRAVQWAWVGSFLFPGFTSASEATDAGRLRDVSGNHLRRPWQVMSARIAGVRADSWPSDVGRDF